MHRETLDQEYYRVRAEMEAAGYPDFYQLLFAHVAYAGKTYRIVNFCWDPGQPAHKRVCLVDPATFHLKQEVFKVTMDELTVGWLTF